MSKTKTKIISNQTVSVKQLDFLKADFEKAKDTFEKARIAWCALEVGGSMKPEEHAEHYKAWVYAKQIFRLAETEYYQAVEKLGGSDVVDCESCPPGEVVK